MSLKTEIDKTNDLKNKTKKAKTNINAKLIEFGGQNATSLADVPNKMQNLICQYKKIAELDINSQLEEGSYTITLSYSISFHPSRAIIYIERINNAYARKYSYDTKKQFQCEEPGGNEIMLTLKSMDSKKMVIHKDSHFNSIFVIKSILFIE